MKRNLLTIFCISTILFAAAASVNAQVDEVSEVTGLPIPIGAPVIYGQVIIRHMPKGAQKPIIYVYLRNGGAQYDKFQATERGYYYFLRAPVDGHTIAYEIDGNEVGSSIIAGGISNRFRQDVEFEWTALRGQSQPAQKTGVVSAKDGYNRKPDNEKLFDKAMASIKAGQNDEATQIFADLCKQDPNDFVAWMMLGSLQADNKKYDEVRKAYKTALDLKPDYFFALLNLGRLELAQKNFAAAIEALGKAVAAEAKSADANQLLGEAYLQSKKGSLAVGYLNKAIKLAPVEKAEIHLRLAALYDGAGLKDRAAAEYKAFLTKVPDYKDKKTLEDYIKKNTPSQ